jgi:hypothetical protein
VPKPAARVARGFAAIRCIFQATVGNPGTSGKPDKLKTMGAIKRFILWDFPRGSWQYDVMVGLILAFIFVTPKTIFHDQPKAASVAILRNGFWIDPQVLNGVAEADMLNKASAAVNAKYKTHTTIVNVDPIFNDEQELQGYMAYTKP